MDGKNDKEVDLAGLDLKPQDIDFDIENHWRDSSTDSSNYLSRIDGTDLWVAYRTWKTDPNQWCSALEGIGRLSIVGIDLDTDVITDMIREEVNRHLLALQEGHEAEAGLYRDVATNAEVFARRLADQWTKKVGPEVLRKATFGGSAGINERFVWTEFDDSFEKEVQEAWLDVGFSVGDESLEGQPKDNVNNALRMGLHDAVERQKTRWRNPHANYIGRVRFEAEAWEVRALELEQKSVFQNKPRLSQSMALREEGHRQSEAAKILGVSPPTISQHWSRQDDLLERAHWTLENVEVGK